MSTLYDRDYYGWTQEQAHLLQAGQSQGLDFAHLAEEVSDLGRSEERAMVRRLRRLLAHLLKLQHGTPHDLERAGRGWRKTCRVQREELAQLLARNPSLRPLLPEAMQNAYRLARLDLDDDALPATCPWTLEAVQREDFFPL